MGFESGVTPCCGPGAWPWSPFVPLQLHGVQPVFRFPVLACQSQAQCPPGLPALATSKWQAGLLLSTARKLQLGAHVLALLLPHPWEVGSLAETVPLLQSAARTLGATEAGLAPCCPLPPGTAASFSGSGEAVN